MHTNNAERFKTNNSLQRRSIAANESPCPLLGGPNLFATPNKHHRGAQPMVTEGYDDNRMIRAEAESLVLKSEGTAQSNASYDQIPYRYITLVLARICGYRGSPIGECSQSKVPSIIVKR